MDSADRIHQRILNKKWESLEERGLIRPINEMENLRRLKELDSLPRGSKQDAGLQAGSVAEVSLG